MSRITVIDPHNANAEQQALLGAIQSWATPITVATHSPSRWRISSRLTMAFQATVSETGWPYVQFRGGPPGFLKVLDKKTIGYADFRGNVQYISVGNLQTNDRIAIILMDVAHRRRLKLMGRVKLVTQAEDPELLARLALPTYRARVERAFIITVEGHDWNCPQHITPRFTEAEIQARHAAQENS